jgi:hypothetical protein
MSKNKTLANIILLIHLILVFIILFGWYFPKIKYLYLASLVITLLSELFFGYCVLTKWEFDIRKKIEPTLEYDYYFLSYYAHKAGVKINRKIIKYTALVFLLSSLIIFYARTYIHR